MKSLDLQPLIDLGLTGLEAAAYAYLLSHAPATGYRVAKGVGKPTANTYKALESLRERGAVATVDTARRAYRAVPPDELLGALERKFRERRERALAELQRVPSPAGDDGVYQLRTVAQVVERCRGMLARAKGVVIVDLSDTTAGMVSADLASCARRGVTVVAKADTPAQIDGVEVVAASPSPVDPLSSSPRLGIVIDAREHLLATFAAPTGESHGVKDVTQAVWSGSPFLSQVYHSGLAAAVFAEQVAQGLDSGLSMDELEVSFERFDRFRMTVWED